MPLLSEFSTAAPHSRYVSQQALLRQTALKFVSDYPDVYGQAWATARQLLLELTGKTLNPDKVWWHRFDGAASSPHTFTGWRHVGMPVESMTLVQLLMHRFTAHDQSALDELQLYGGFYSDGPQHGSFDEHNEIAVLPRRLLERFWALDFASAYRQRVDGFWESHAQAFCELARVRFLAAARLALRSGELSLDDVQVLVRAVTPIAEVPEAVTPAVLQRSRQLGIRSFALGGFESSQVLRIIDGNGWQIVYAPGLRKPFKICRSERELYEWVRSQLADTTSRRHFEALFLAAPLATEERTQGVRQVLEQIHGHAFAAEHNLIDTLAARLLNQGDRQIHGDVFEHLRDLARDEMYAVAAGLTSNADLRKQVWLGYLSAFIRISGPLAVLTWPLGLVVTGAAVASVALNVDQALHGKTALQRKAGMLGAILDSVFVLFNLPVLVDSLAGLRAVRAEVPDVAVPGSAAPAAEESDEEWIALQTLNHERLLSGNVPMQGVERSASGETWIMLDEVPHPVRFSASLDSWVLFDPTNPFAFYQTLPVRLNAQGVWQRVYGLRLSGGAPMDPALVAELAGPSSLAGEAAQALPLSTVQSEFWDIYMQFNLEEEESLSLLAVDRQKAAIDILEFQPGDEIERDAEGAEVLVDVWSNEFRVFKTARGRYVGGRVTRYTEQEERFNHYLRTGVANISNQTEMIEELLQDLNLIGRDNRVNLYRGGSGARGTSGLTFRNGHIKAGDVLVNTDFTSFTENPYVTRSFASSQAGVQSYSFSGPVTFDETSIVFELPAGRYLGAVPIAPFSVEDEEAELLFTPGHYFKVQGIHEVAGPNYRFVRVQLREVAVPPAGSRQYEMRTGLPFTREMYATRLGEEGKRLVDRFFPQPLDLSPTAS